MAPLAAAFLIVSQVVPTLAQDASADDTPSVGSAAGTGAIAYMRPDEDGLWQIWTTCPDMSHDVQVTAGPSSRSGWPSWSPDGTRIAFNTDRDDPAWSPTVEGSVWDIYTMDAAGEDLVKLTASIGLAADPSYSPDGTLIAFGSDAPGMAGIHVMDAADGSDARRITTLPADASVDYAPRFSPDGTRLLFTRAMVDGTSALYTVGLDGTGLIRVTPPSLVPNEADWSPDGRTIAVGVYSPDFPFGSVWVMGPDGAGLTNLTPPSAEQGVQSGLSDPIWSPDGSLILLTYGQYADNGTSTSGLAAISPDGTGLRYLGDGLDEGEKMDWARAGSC